MVLPCPCDNFFVNYVLVCCKEEKSISLLAVPRKIYLYELDNRNLYYEFVITQNLLDSIKIVHILCTSLVVLSQTYVELFSFLTAQKYLFDGKMRLNIIWLVKQCFDQPGRLASEEKCEAYTLYIYVFDGKGLKKKYA